jgi:predicted HD superfamily hydrolase involved in NAD metabolism
MTTASHYEVEGRLRDAVEALPDGLRRHILRVEKESCCLAETHGVDADRARIAALGHDLVRHLSGPDLLAMAAKYRLTPDPIEQASPVLVHGPVAARILTTDYALDDAEILAGIDCHTTARAGMTVLEQVLFVADKVEPHKRKRDDALINVRETARESLDAAVLQYLDHNLKEAIRRRWQVHPRSLEARNELVSRLGG